MPRPAVDLVRAFRTTLEPGHSADFAVSLKPVSYQRNGAFEAVPGRRAVVRVDTGEPLAIVSERYTLVPHTRLLELVGQATRTLDLGAVHSGIYVDRKGARLRALFKFPDLTRPVTPGDTICPCLKVVNTYDGTSRICVHIGAFRFVCTNLAIGGGGIFASGFMAVHQGDIPIDQVAEELSSYLGGFSRLVETYCTWRETPLEPETFDKILSGVALRTACAIREGYERSGERTVYAGHNAGTWYATHQMRSATSAFQLLARLNRAFQDQFPPSLN